jgi:hypothetical protein
MDITTYDVYKKAIDTDELPLIILQCALICEQCMGEILFPDDIPQRGFLTFGSKHSLLRKDKYKHLHQILPLDGLMALGELRNKIAHRLFYKVTEEDLAIIGILHEPWALKHCEVISKFEGYKNLHLFHKEHWGEQNFIPPLARTLGGLICYPMQVFTNALKAEQGAAANP